MARSCARRNLAAETTFMALVICRVLITLRIRRRMSRMLGISRRDVTCYVSFSAQAQMLYARDVANYVSTNYFATAARDATNCCFASLITFCNWPFNRSEEH